MDPSDVLKAVLALRFIKKMGPVSFKKLMERYGNLSSVLRAKRAQIENSFLEKADREMKLAKNSGVEILNILDSRYPPLLREIHDPPMLLYVKGVLPQPGIPTVAVVGARQASSYGLDTAHRLAGDLARAGVTVVSGMALGIDSAAHEGALAAGGSTVAVLGGGLSHIYPAANLKLAKAIERHGALLSEYPMEEKPRPEYFPLRNRIISGLSSAVLVVEAREKSGALITASAALEQGREVFAVPGNVNASRSSGTNALLKEGASPATDASDILAVLSVTAAPPEKPAREPLNDAESRLLSLLDAGDPVHVEELVQKSGLGARRTASTLSFLEIKGRVRQRPGKYFQREITAHESGT
jgi:DNA processing protein